MNWKSEKKKEDIKLAFLTNIQLPKVLYVLH